MLWCSSTVMIFSVWFLRCEFCFFFVNVLGCSKILTSLKV